MPEPNSSRERSDGATTSPSPVRTSRPDAARIHSVSENASVEFIGRSPVEDSNASSAPTEAHFLGEHGWRNGPQDGLGTSWSVGLAFDAKIFPRLTYLVG